MEQNLQHPVTRNNSPLLTWAVGCIKTVPIP